MLKEIFYLRRPGSLPQMKGMGRGWKRGSRCEFLRSWREELCGHDRQAQTGLGRGPGTGGKQGVGPGRAVDHPRTDEESTANGETEAQTEDHQLPHWAVAGTLLWGLPRAPPGGERTAPSPGGRPPVAQVSRSALAPGQPVRLQAATLRVLSDVQTLPLGSSRVAAKKLTCRGHPAPSAEG